MATILRELRASYAFVERNFALVRRYLGWEVVFLIYAIVNTLTIGLIGVGVPGVSMNPETVLYLVSGALLWGFLSVLFQEVGNSVSWERWEGTIEYTFMAPVHRLTHLGGTCLFAIAYGLLRTIITLAAVALFFKLDLSQANLWAALVVLAASSLSFIGLGLMAAVLPLLSPEKGAQATNIVQAGLLLVSGVYYSVSALPNWLQPLAYISPGTYVLRATREALLHGAGVAQVAGDIWILLAIGVASIPLGLWVFGIGERWAMVRGKLKRNG
ncbi:MAG TPA: ABC transporter permease [Limnochordia bacterium]|nr:ABC transporter permease [Limnochordia bacterium]